MRVLFRTKQAENIIAEERCKRARSVKVEEAYWTGLSEVSVRNIWDNEEDDVYNELLKK